MAKKKKLLMVLFKNEKIDQKDLAEPLADHLKKQFGFQVEQIEIDFPQVEKREGQYQANELLPFKEKFGLKKKKIECDFILVVTDKDLFMPELNFIFGLALPEQKEAIISLNRLRSNDLKQFLERAVKEAVHELGHVLGLGHCPNPKCVMHFSNALKDTDIKGKEYCDKCGKALALVDGD